VSFTLLGILNSQAAGAGGAGAYDLLETTILASDAASVEFTGLDAYTDYKHLQLRMVTRNDGAFAGGGIVLTINSDTGTNYADHRLRGDGSSVTSAGFTSQTNAVLGAGAGGTNGANQFSATVIDILDFSSTAKNTTLMSLSGVAADSRTIIELDSGLYISTNAVTNIQIADSADFVTGSRFSLYGVK
jgi:nicotinate-nucleotide pyrophosphorylase